MRRTLRERLFIALCKKAVGIAFAQVVLCMPGNPQIDRKTSLYYHVILNNSC